MGPVPLALSSRFAGQLEESTCFVVREYPVFFPCNTWTNLSDTTVRRSLHDILQVDSIKVTSRPAFMACTHFVQVRMMTPAMFKTKQAEAANSPDGNFVWTEKDCTSHEILSWLHVRGDGINCVCVGWT